jgi:hypothetical protein
MRELLRPDDSRDALRALGALLLGAGFLVLSLRKDNPSSFVENDGWGDFTLFVMYLIPAVVLYGGAVVSFPETDERRPWQSIGSVLGLLFVTLTLSQFVDLIGGNSSASLNVAWIAIATAGLAFYVAIIGEVRFQFLVGGIALLVAWLAVWNELLDTGIFDDLGTLRGLLGLFAVGMLAAGLYLWRTLPDGLWKASEFLTVAGIAAVLGTAVISLTGSFIGELAAAFAPGRESAGGEPTLFWDILTLLVALGLILLGTLIGTRGPVYVGAIGLLLFIVIVGQNLDAESPENGFAGWPLVLLLLGAIAIGLSFLREASLGDQPRRFVQDLRRR